jgi:tRNA(Phe) wybutosine-synthesizing methylase Tyw3
MATRRIDDTKIDKLETLVAAQNETLYELKIGMARVEEKLNSHADKTEENKKEIEGVKNGQKWLVLTVVGALISSVVNFFFRGGN